MIGLRAIARRIWHKSIHSINRIPKRGTRDRRTSSISGGKIPIIERPSLLLKEEKHGYTTKKSTVETSVWNNGGTLSASREGSELSSKTDGFGTCHCAAYGVWSCPSRG